MANKATKQDSVRAQVRATAIKHALSIEEKKKLANRASDLVLQAYDIPENKSADPALPDPVDAALFQECLRLFRPVDLDELVSERNIDERCGYALCPKPRRKLEGAGIKTWNRKGGKGFKLLNTADLEQWCSDLCGDRAAFVRAQLSPEPAWMREVQNDVRLLDEVRQTEAVETLSEAVRALAFSHGELQGTTERLHELSLERGESVTRDVSDEVSLVEKDTTSSKSKPPTAAENGNTVEGYRERKVRFANP